MLTPATKLSPREAQIASLIAAGYTDMRIAAELKISYYTVRAYARSIRDKLNTQGPRINLARQFERCCSV